MLPFYINICVHALYIPAFLFLLPESLSSQARAMLSKQAVLESEAAARREVAEREWEAETPGVIADESDPLLTANTSASEPGSSTFTSVSRRYSAYGPRRLGGLGRGGRGP